MSNKKNIIYQDIRKTQFVQQPVKEKRKEGYNPFHSNVNQNNYQKLKAINIPQSINQRHTVSTPFPPDNLFDLKSTNSVLGFIPPEPQNNNPSIQIKKISKKNNILSNNNNKIQRNNNNYINKPDILTENTKRNKISKGPLDEISNNSSSNNRNIKSKLDISNPNNQSKLMNLQNQFINRNIEIFNILVKMQFLEKLNNIRKERMNLFEKEFRKDIFFMKKDFFDNTFIKEEIDKFSPLTLIFHFIFNPETKILQLSPQKSFFESIFQQRGDKNIKINYSPNDLKQVPKYFNDFNYVNNLFNNFNEIELNNFINEIKNWKKTFSFELQFVHPLKNNIGKTIGQNQIEINEVVKIYFISPNDLIVDYHTYAENFPLSDSFVSITQYNFHCDIKYDKNNGRFIFKTNAIVYNKLQIVNQNIIQNVIKKEANNINGFELLVNTWKPLVNIINEESKKNKIIMDKIFKEHLRKNLNKYSKNKPDINIKKTKVEKNIKNKNDINEKKIININDNFNVNNCDDIFDETLENIKLNESKNNNILKNKDISSLNKINEIKNGNNNVNKKILKEKNINNIEEIKQNSLLFYGVLITFFLFIFKTILSIEYGNISLETFFNVLIIIIIGFMLIKNYIIDNNNSN